MSKVAVGLFIVATMCLTALLRDEAALAYPAGQNLGVLVSARSVDRAGDRLMVSAKNVEPGCSVNFSWEGQPVSGTPSAIADSTGLTTQVRLSTPAIAAKYTLRATLIRCAANTGATQATVAITVGRHTKITCTDTASNYSAKTSPVLRHDCYLKWGSQPIASHALRVRLLDPSHRQLSWHTFTTDSSGAIHVVYVNKVTSRGTYVFDTYYSPEKTYISNELTTTIAISR